MLAESVLAVVVFAATPAPAAAHGAPLADGFPVPLPRPEVLVHWELIQGRGDSNGRRVAYRFYVDPARPALYRLTQYRLAPETEKLLWNGAPGAGPLDLYELLPQGWTRMETGSDRYRAEMATAIRIYNLHRSLAVYPEP